MGFDALEETGYNCMTACLRLPTDNIISRPLNMLFLFNLTIKVMITKAILELNACVNALRSLRTFNWEMGHVYYNVICHNRSKYLADQVFKARECYEMSAILRKVTNNTAGQIYSMDELDVFIEDYLKKNNVIVPNEVADALVEYYHDTPNECRRCSICGRLMQEGYCQDAGYRYYCSDDCLHHDFTDEEWNKECDNNDQSYWTQWY